MKYYLDTEFIEGSQSKWLPFLGSYGKTNPTIDLISIGIVSEDNRQYYAISKEFNLKEAWNRCQINTHLAIGGNVEIKQYWLRDNVLKPIFKEFLQVEADEAKEDDTPTVDFTYKEFKKLLMKYGKTNKRIAEEVKTFCCEYPHPVRPGKIADDNIQFYGYYCDYDWVVFCWLFGLMIDLPKGFPMYCIDVKQKLDEKANEVPSYYLIVKDTFKDKLNYIKERVDYPVGTNSHNALQDAIECMALDKFLDELSFYPKKFEVEGKVLDFANKIKDKHLKKLYYKHFNIFNER